MRSILPLFILLASNLFAQDSPIPPDSSDKKILKIDVSTFEPFVALNNGKITGFDIDVVENLTSKNGYKCEYRVVPFDDIFKGIQDGSADFAIGGISITGSRESQVDFTHPYFLTGKQILVMNKKDEHRITKYVSSIVLNTNIPKIFIIFFCFVVLAAHIVWILERGDNQSIHKDYFQGIFDTIYFVVTTMATVGYGDISPRKRKTKLIVMLVMLSGIALFSWSISEFQAEIVKQKLDYGIRNKEDLKGHKIAVVSGTTSESAIRESDGLNVVKVDDIKDAYFALFMEDVDAVISDSAILKYYAKVKGKGKVSVVGDLFGKESYGIAMKEGNSMRNKLNIEIIKMILDEDADGSYISLMNKWGLSDN